MRVAGGMTWRAGRRSRLRARVYTHFHTCGVDPGNVATATFDATIRFDGATLWETGRPVFLERPEMQALLRKHRVSGSVFTFRRDIGL